MKKILFSLLVAVLILSCLVGCGSKEPEKAMEAISHQTEEATEVATVPNVEATEEEAEKEFEEEFEDEIVAEIVFEPTTATITDLETGATAQITYNGAYYRFLEDVAMFPMFEFSAEDDLVYAYEEALAEEYPDMEFNEMPFLYCMAEFQSGKTAQDFYDIRYSATNGSDSTGSANVTEMITTAVEAGTLYIFDEYWTSDNSILYRYAIWEAGFGAIVFYVPIFEEEGILELAFNHFFIDAAAA